MSDITPTDADSRDRTARRLVHDTELLKHHLGADHWWCGPDEIEGFVRIDIYQDTETDRVLGVLEGDYFLLTVPSRHAAYAILPHGEDAIELALSQDGGMYVAARGSTAGAARSPASARRRAAKAEVDLAETSIEQRMSGAAHALG